MLIQVSIINTLVVLSLQLLLLVERQMNEIIMWAGAVRYTVYSHLLTRKLCGKKHSRFCAMHWICRRNGLNTSVSLVFYTQIHEILNMARAQNPPTVFAAIQNKVEQIGSYIFNRRVSSGTKRRIISQRELNQFSTF